MSLGLNRHIVKLVPHDPNWKAIFEETRVRLWEVLGELVLDIQHVGSSSIPGLPAKPIMDIGIAVQDQSVMFAIIRKLVSMGYIYRGDGGDEGGHLFVKEIEYEVRSEHLHVVEIDNFQWRNYLHFRDTLTANPELKEEYAQLKLALAKQYPNDREAYLEGKEAFIQRVLTPD